MQNDDSVIDRLARIETKQEATNEKMDKILGLLDRIVIVEERQQSHISTTERRFAEHDSRIRVNTIELDSWKTARRIIVWVTGILGTAMAALIVASSTYVIDALR